MLVNAAIAPYVLAFSRCYGAPRKYWSADKFMSNRARCVIILSTKSSGSSALQELLCDFGGGRHVQRTRHGEFETLYWTKAASILGRPQVRLPDSEVPIRADRALRDLRTLIFENTGLSHIPEEGQPLVLEGWRQLCQSHRPVFVEKSPHHLHQWSCMELMTDAARRLPDIDFRFVGLVRNPMDVMYSAWTRWRLAPENFQQHWRQAYENLEKFRLMVGDRLIIVRYEEFSSSNRTASRLLESLGLSSVRSGADDYIHGASRSRWKDDHRFGFELDPAVRELAIRFGYETQDLANRRRPDWPLRRIMSQTADRLISRPLARVRRQLRPFFQ